MCRKPIGWIGIVLLACGGNGSSPVPEPQSPTVALDRFLGAIETKNYQGIALLWGNRGGAAQANRKLSAGYIDSVSQILEIYLRHDSYRILNGPKPTPGNPNLMTFNVELELRTCKHVQPIDMIRTRHGGWLVRDPHIEAAAKTVVQCPK